MPTTANPGQVLIVTALLSFGGLETHVLEQARSLAKRDWRVWVIAAGAGTLMREWFAQEGLDLLVKPSPEEVRELVAACGRPGVVHAHPYAQEAAAALSEVLGWPLFITLHGLHGWGNGQELDQAATVFCVSMETATKLLQARPRARAQLLENAVDLSRYQPPNQRQPHPRLRVAFLGRLENDRLPIATSLLHAAQQADLELHILGGGSLCQSLEQEASEEAYFYGPVREVWRVLPGLDCAVAAGRGVREAMACGLAAVAAAPKQFEVVTPARAEHLRYANFSGRGASQPLTPANLARHLASLAADPQELRRLQNFSALYARQHFDQDKVGKTLEEAYLKAWS